MFLAVTGWRTGISQGLVEPSLRLMLLYRIQKRTELGAKLLAQIPKKGVTHLLGSMTLNSADGFCETVVLS